MARPIRSIAWPSAAWAAGVAIRAAKSRRKSALSPRRANILPGERENVGGQLLLVIPTARDLALRPPDLGAHTAGSQLDSRFQSQKAGDVPRHLRCSEVPIGLVMVGFFIRRLSISILV